MTAIVVRLPRGQQRRLRHTVEKTREAGLRTRSSTVGTQRLIAGGSELVFPNRFGKHMNLRNLRRRVWTPALEEAGLKRRDLHNTRHTFATHTLASGEDPGWVAKMLGHMTLTMLMTRYYRYVPNLTRRDAMLFARRLAAAGDAVRDLQRVDRAASRTLRAK